MQQPKTRATFDPEMLEQSELICRVPSPRVVRVEWPTRIAGIALIHRDQAIAILGQVHQRVDRRPLPKSIVEFIPPGASSNSG